MRKRLLPVLLGALVVVVVFVLAALRFSAPRSISMSWDYSYAAHDLPCASPSAEDCVTGFRVFVGDRNHRSQQLFIANRPDAGQNRASQQLAANFTVNRFGYLQFCVLAVRNGRGGLTYESIPVCKKRLVLPFAIGSSWAK